MPSPTAFRVLFECTPTAQTDLARGIPRVVRSIVNHSTDVVTEFGGTACPITYGYGGWSEAAWRSESPIHNSETAPQRQRLKEFLSRVISSPGLRRLLFPPPGRDGIWKIPRRAIGESRRLAGRFTQPRIRPGCRDVLVLLDPWWRCPEGFWRNVAKARRNGARIATVIYDLIPITHPEFVGPRHALRFRRWLHRAAGCTDIFLAISNTVKEGLCSYLRDSRPEQPWPEERFHSFILGADLPVDTQGAVRDAVRRTFCDGNTYLMVGALEPRKNQPFLVDAFECLWRRNVDVRLCLVGGYTKSMPDFHERLTRHVELGRRLFYYSDLTDAELDYCYRKTPALVYPSLVEGFGLPIVEALKHGTPVMASDTPIHREVGGEFCAYFDLASTDMLVELIAQCERLGHLPNVHSVAEYVAPSWKRSCSELIEACFRQFGEYCCEKRKTNRAA